MDAMRDMESKAMAPYRMASQSRAIAWYSAAPRSEATAQLGLATNGRAQQW